VAWDLARYLFVKELLGTEAGSIELSPDITVELNERGELTSIEILNASKFMRDVVLESVQARMLQFPVAQPA
jgi:uncharacterized protein YuzE